jgi:hypothetical protein
MLFLLPTDWSREEADAFAARFGVEVNFAEEGWGLNLHEDVPVETVAAIKAARELK